MNRRSFNKNVEEAIERKDDNTLAALVEQGLQDNIRIEQHLAQTLVKKLEDMKRRSSREALRLQSSITRLVDPYFQYHESIWGSQSTGKLGKRWKAQSLRVRRTITQRILDDTRSLIPDVNQIILSYIHKEPRN